jgi:hypothetical protein
MRRLSFLILFAVAGSPPFAQVRHGTIGVVYYTDDKIIVAADSRALISVDSHSEDKECKIATPSGKLVFVSSGASEFYKVGAQLWSNIEEIHEAYNAAWPLYSNNYDRIEDTAIQWGKSISSKWQSLLPEYSDMVINAARDGKGVLTRAIIGGFDDDRKPVIGQIIVSYNEGDSTVQFDAGRITCPHSICAIGKVQIEEEFLDLTSERARNEAESWKPPKDSKPADYDIFRIMRFVELTIKYRGVDVGGAIDAVQMDKDGSVHWFANKKNCAEN